MEFDRGTPGLDRRRIIIGEELDAAVNLHLRAKSFLLAVPGLLKDGVGNDFLKGLMSCLLVLCGVEYQSVDVNDHESDFVLHFSVVHLPKLGYCAGAAEVLRFPAELRSL